ncbi:plasma protease C1 inhibitor [Pelodytes ibericus]
MVCNGEAEDISENADKVNRILQHFVPTEIPADGNMDDPTPKPTILGTGITHDADDNSERKDPHEEESENNEETKTKLTSHETESRQTDVEVDPESNNAVPFSKLGPKEPATEDNNDTFSDVTNESCGERENTENTTMEEELSDPESDTILQAEETTQENLEPEKDQPDTYVDIPNIPTPTPCAPVWPECAMEHMDNATEQVAKALASFSVNLYKMLSPYDSHQNLAVAPISIVLALSHLMLGTGKKTRDIMLKNIYKGVTETQCVHEALQNMFNKDSFLSASEVFYKKDLALTTEFLNQSMKYYGSGGKELSNVPENSLKLINEWVSQKTAQRIPKLLQEISDDLQLLLINAIFYQGKWLTRFDPARTKKESFQQTERSEVKVLMMNRHKYPLQTTKDKYLKAQVARFPLSNNISFVIILPQSSENVEKVGRRLNGAIVRTLIKQLQELTPRPTSVSIPRLKLDSDNELVDTLSKLDLDNIFYNPDLCGLSTQSDLAVSDVRHRVVLEVAEDGVAAAAATAVSVARTVNIFMVRRPFIFILASDITNIPLFIGHVNDPSK